MNGCIYKTTAIFFALLSITFSSFASSTTTDAYRAKRGCMACHEANTLQVDRQVTKPHEKQHHKHPSKKAH